METPRSHKLRLILRMKTVNRRFKTKSFSDLYLISRCLNRVLKLQYVLSPRACHLMQTQQQQVSAVCTAGDLKLLRMIPEIVRRPHPHQPGLISLDIEVPSIVRYYMRSMRPDLDWRTYHPQYLDKLSATANALPSQNTKLLEANDEDIGCTTIPDAIRLSAGIDTILITGLPMIQSWRYDLTSAHNLFKTYRIPVQGNDMHLHVFTDHWYVGYC